MPLTQEEQQQLRNVKATLEFLSGEAKVEFNRIMSAYADNTDDLIDGIGYALSDHD